MPRYFIARSCELSNHNSIRVEDLSRFSTSTRIVLWRSVAPHLLPEPPNCTFDTIDPEDSPSLQQASKSLPNNTAESTLSKQSPIELCCINVTPFLAIDDEFPLHTFPSPSLTTSFVFPLMQAVNLNPGSQRITSVSPNGDVYLIQPNNSLVSSLNRSNHLQIAKSLSLRHLGKVLLSSPSLMLRFTSSIDQKQSTNLLQRSNSIISLSNSWQQQQFESSDDSAFSQWSNALALRVEQLLHTQHVNNQHIPTKTASFKNQAPLTAETSPFDVLASQQLDSYNSSLHLSTDDFFDSFFEPSQNASQTNDDFHLSQNAASLEATHDNASVVENVSHSQRSEPAQIQPSFEALQASLCDSLFNASQNSSMMLFSHSFGDDGNEEEEDDDNDDHDSPDEGNKLDNENEHQNIKKQRMNDQVSSIQNDQKTSSRDENEDEITKKRTEAISLLLGGKNSQDSSSFHPTISSSLKNAVDAAESLVSRALSTSELTSVTSELLHQATAAAQRAVAQRQATGTKSNSSLTHGELQTSQDMNTLLRMGSTADSLHSLLDRGTFHLQDVSDAHYDGIDAEFIDNQLDRLFNQYDYEEGDDDDGDDGDDNLTHENDHRYAKSSVEETDHIFSSHQHHQSTISMTNEMGNAITQPQGGADQKRSIIQVSSIAEGRRLLELHLDLGLPLPEFELVIEEKELNSAPVVENSSTDVPPHERDYSLQLADAWDQFKTAQDEQRQKAAQEADRQLSFLGFQSLSSIYSATTDVFMGSGSSTHNTTRTEQPQIMTIAKYHSLYQQKVDQQQKLRAQRIEAEQQLKREQSQRRQQKELYKRESHSQKQEPPSHQLALQKLQRHQSKQLKQQQNIQLQHQQNAEQEHKFAEELRELRDVQQNVTRSGDLSLIELQRLVLKQSSQSQTQNDEIKTQSQIMFNSDKNLSQNSSQQVFGSSQLGDSQSKSFLLPSTHLKSNLPPNEVDPKRAKRLLEREKRKIQQQKEAQRELRHQLRQQISQEQQTRIDAENEQRMHNVSNSLIHPSQRQQMEEVQRLTARLAAGLPLTSNVPDEMPSERHKLIWGTQAYNQYKQQQQQQQQLLQLRQRRSHRSSQHTTDGGADDFHREKVSFTRRQTSERPRGISSADNNDQLIFEGLLTQTDEVDDENKKKQQKSDRALPRNPLDGDLLSSSQLLSQPTMVNTQHRSEHRSSSKMMVPSTSSASQNKGQIIIPTLNKSSSQYISSSQRSSTTDPGSQFQTKSKNLMETSNLQQQLQRTHSSTKTLSSWQSSPNPSNLLPLAQPPVLLQTNIISREIPIEQQQSSLLEYMQARMSHPEKKAEKRRHERKMQKLKAEKHAAKQAAKEAAKEAAKQAAATQASTDTIQANQDLQDKSIPADPSPPQNNHSSVPNPSPHGSDFNPPLPSRKPSSVRPTSILEQIKLQQQKQQEAAALLRKTKAEKEKQLQ